MRVGPSEVEILAGKSAGYPRVYLHQSLVLCVKVGELEMKRQSIVIRSGKSDHHSPL